MPVAEKSVPIQLHFSLLLISLTHMVTHMEMLNVLFIGCLIKIALITE